MGMGQVTHSGDDAKTDKDRDGGDNDGWQRDPGMPVRDFFGTDVVTASGIHVFGNFFHYFLRM